MKTLRIAGFAAGVAALRGAAVFVTASAAGFSFGASPRPAATVADQSGGPAGSGVCNEFVSHFSSDLGTSQSNVDAAFQKAIGEPLADEVKAGRLTQAQADALKARLADKAPGALAGHLGGKHPAG